MEEIDPIPEPLPNDAEIDDDPERPRPEQPQTKLPPIPGSEGASAGFRDSNYPDLEADFHVDEDSTRTPPVLAGSTLGPRARWILAGGLSILVLATVLGVIGWWSASPARPPMELLDIEQADAEAPVTDDVEQLAFLRQHDMGPPAARLPELPGNASSGLTSLIDYTWIDRLAGRWTLDLGNRALSIVFGAVAVKRVPGELLTLELYPVAGLGLPPYFTILRRSETESFLAFQNEAGQYVGLLDDLQVHDEDLISYRIGGTSQRRYGHRSGNGDNHFDSPLPERPEETLRPSLEQEQDRFDRDRPAAPEPVEIIVERRSVDELWQRAQQLKENGRLDSLESALDRVLAADSSHRKARRWRRSLSKWRTQQRKKLRSRLNSHLETLEEAVEEQDLDDALELWAPGARSNIQSFLARFFSQFDRTNTRVQLKNFEIDDGTLIFDVALTFEGFDGRQRSIETHSWRARLYGEFFLDPFPG